MSQSKSFVSLPAHKVQKAAEAYLAHLNAKVEEIRERAIQSAMKPRRRLFGLYQTKGRTREEAIAWLKGEDFYLSKLVLIDCTYGNRRNQLRDIIAAAKMTDMMNLSITDAAMLKGWWEK